MSSLEGSLEGRSYWYQLLVLFALWFAAFVGFAFIGALIQEQFIGIESLTPSEWENLDDPKIINTYRWLQIILSVGIFILPAYIFAKMRGDWKKELAFHVPVKFTTLILTVLMVIASWPVVYLLLEVNQAIPFPEALEGIIKRMEDTAAAMLKTLITIQNPYDLFVVFLMVAIIPAVGEELLFRGAMQPLLIKITGSALIGIVLCGFIFSFMHMQFLGFLPRMGLGILFGIIFYYSGSIWIVIFAHFVHNGAQLAFHHLHESGIIEVDPEKPDVFPIYFVVFSALILIFIISLIRKVEQKEEIP